jgi:hypothetical protein
MADQPKSGAIAIDDADVEIIHNPDEVVSLYIDGMQGITVVNNVARINLFQLIQHYGKSEKDVAIKKKFVGQLILSPTILPGIARWLAERASELSESPATTESVESSDGGR